MRARLTLRSVLALSALAAAGEACGASALERLADEPTTPVAPASAGPLGPASPSATAPAPALSSAPSAVAEVSDTTRSPWPVLDDADADPRARALARSCGDLDGALERVARAAASTRARGLGSPDADRIAAMLRAAGEPHVRPRVLAASGRAPIDEAALPAKLSALAGPRARCGVALAMTPHGGELLVAIAVDALADLAPLPQRTRPGEWLALEAKLHVEARGARVVLTGPRGLPRTVPAHLDAARRLVRARFAVDRPGAFLVQVVGDVEGGPRPLLEARLYADVAPLALDDAPAPGEDAADGEDDAALERMITALRASEGLPAFTRDRRLDALARAHAEHMERQGTVAHDLGDGDLRARFDAAGLTARKVGENVAHAATLARAHRALHASPSHRMNLLDAYARVGLAVRHADDGSVYVCEVFGTD